MNTCISTFDERYNPSVEALSLAALKDLFERGQLAAGDVNRAEISFNNATAARTAQFNDFDDLNTRIINAVRISGASAQTCSQIETIVRELRGKRASELLSDQEIAAEKAKGNDVNQVTLHNTTFDRKIENFGKLTLSLEAISEYKPNEADLSVAGLNARLAAYKEKNNDTLTTEATLSAARQARDKLLYTEGSGLVDTALSVKLYVKSAFGATSTQYKQISSIEFTKPR